MRVLIRVEGAATGRTLLNWLLADPVSGEAEITPAAGGPGEMGAELVQAVIANEIALTSLAFSVLTWWDARRRKPGETDAEVWLEVGGTAVRVKGSDHEEVARIVRALTEDAGSRPQP
ncbi:effector-associated constant component EACC1 [Actinomadura rayongensis]|uniref:Uncharacterized protein n=1 Tax=Actinomadura rayongensis TaxID=1429076 RepID=A0A6I4WCL2_9ACTN|nr:hypothetical protein [Actinomadura rayongensis]MXQ65656.1 hypothetical protein [Actinomadura rayongensis]